MECVDCMAWYDIANFVIDIVTAIATLGATLLALYLALRDRSQRIDCVFMWETATEDKPMIILNNIGDRTVIVERVDLIFDGHKICNVDILRRSAYSENAIISPNKEVRIVLDLNDIKQNVKGRPAKNPDTIYNLTAVVTTTNKKKYKSSYRYCYNDILGLLFSGTLTSDCES